MNSSRKAPELRAPAMPGPARTGRPVSIWVFVAALVLDACMQVAMALEQGVAIGPPVLFMLLFALWGREAWMGRAHGVWFYLGLAWFSYLVDKDGIQVPAPDGAIVTSQVLALLATLFATAAALHPDTRAWFRQRRRMRRR